MYATLEISEGTQLTVTLLHVKTATFLPGTGPRYMFYPASQ